jgi:ribosomal protein S28E/S33
MPIRYELDDARRRLVVTVEGPFAVADFLAIMERQRDDGAWTWSFATWTRPSGG